MSAIKPTKKDAGRWLLFLSLALAAAGFSARLSAFSWNPAAERWGSLFTAYGYDLSGIATVIFILAAFCAVEWLMRKSIPPAAAYLFSGIVLFILFFSLRSRVKIGDSIDMMMSASGGMAHVKEVLSTYTMHLAYVLLGPWGLDPFAAIQAVYCALGAAAALVIRGIARRLFSGPAFLATLVFWFVVFQFGVLQELCADAEIYAPCMAVMAVYLAICLRAQERKPHPFVPAFAFGAAFCFYSGFIFLFPSTVYLVWRLNSARVIAGKGWPRFFLSLVKSVFYLVAGFLLPYLAVYGLFMGRPDYMTSGEYGGASGFVPLKQIFSAGHLFDMLSLQLLMQPAVWGLFLCLAAGVIFYRKIPRGDFFDAPVIFLGLASAGMLFYSFIWDIYGTGLLWRNDFLTSWHTFSGLTLPASLLSCYLFVKLFSGSRILRLSLAVWTVAALSYSAPLLLWNHAHESVDFANFSRPGQTLLNLKGGAALACDLDVGSPFSEKKYHYAIEGTRCSLQARFPPGVLLLHDRVYFSPCRNGLIRPVASMCPSYLSVSDGGRLCLVGESFTADLISGKEAVLIMRMHTGFGPQKVKAALGGRELGEIEVDPAQIEIPVSYRRYPYDDLTFVNWPSLYEWRWWREVYWVVPGEYIKGGPTQVKITNLGPAGYGSFHYFIYQSGGKKSAGLPKETIRKDYLFPLGAFQSQITGGAWQRLEESRVTLGGMTLFPPRSFQADNFIYRNAALSGDLLFAFSVRSGKIGYVSFPVNSPEVGIFAPQFLANFIFKDDPAGQREFCRLCDELIYGERQEAHFSGVHLSRRLAPLSGKQPIWVIEVLGDVFSRELSTE